MRKTKKELEEELMKYKKERKLYREFWETDAIEMIQRRNKNMIIICEILAIILLICSLLFMLFSDM